MKTLTLDEAVSKPGELIDYLTYCSYRHNREISPDTTPEQWKAIFKNVDEMEKRYQKEKQG